MKTKFITRFLATTLAISLVLTSNIVDTTAFAKSSNHNLKAEVISGKEKLNKLRALGELGDSTNYKELVSTDGIAKAFQEKNFTSLYNDKKFLLSNEENLEAKYDKSAEGLYISGKATDFTDSKFSFAEEFDFSEGIIERIQLDAISEKANTLKLELFLDDDMTSFATVSIVKQKRAKKWFNKVSVTNIYDKKITGKHSISFKIVQEDSEKNVGLVLRTLTFVKSTLPTVYFNLDETLGTINEMNSDPEHNTECYGNVTIQVPDGYKCEYANKDGKTNNVKTETYELEYIRGRGNSTWTTSKKPYKFKLDKKADLFNMGKNKHWVLLADYYDPSHIRNKITYYMGEKFGLAFTPKCVYVDVVMNGEYYGSYLLAEQIRLDSNRVDLDDLESISDFRAIDPADKSTITGGYLLSMSPYSDKGEKVFSTQRGNEFLIESPSILEYDEDEKYQPACEYITKYMQDTENAIYSNDRSRIESLMDIQKSIDYWWFQEFSMNGDGFISGSTYLYKPRDSKLVWGPLWDFDFVAWGNNEYKNADSEYSSYNIEGWSMSDRTWFEKLLKYPEISKDAIASYKRLSPILSEAAKKGGVIDQYASQITYSMYYNNMLHGNNYEESLNPYTFQQSVDQFKDWITNRKNWVDENINTLEAKEYTVTFMDGNKKIGTSKVFAGDKVIFPKLSAKKGYIHTGWYTKSNYDGSTYEEDIPGEYYVYEDTTVYARWIKEEDFVAPSAIILGYDYKGVFYDTQDGDGYAYIPYAFVGGAASDSEIEWSTSDANVAVPQGYGDIKLNGYGDAIITASYTFGKKKISASCKLHVMSWEQYDVTPLESYDIKCDKKSIKIGESTVISVNPSPVEAFDMNVDYSVMGENVGVNQVGNKLLVTAYNLGTAKIYIDITSDYNEIYNREVVKIDVRNKYNDPVEIKPGSKVKRNHVTYKVVSIVKNGGTVTVTGTDSKKLAKLNIPKNITIYKKKYRVVSVSKNAFKKNTKLKSITIGANVKKIGANAFYGCKNVKKVTIKTTKLTAKNVGKNAFKGLNKKVKLVLPKSKTKQYIKFFK